MHLLAARHLIFTTHWEHVPLRNNTPTLLAVNATDQLKTAALEAGVNESDIKIPSGHPDDLLFIGEDAVKKLTAAGAQYKMVVAVPAPVKKRATIGLFKRKKATTLEDA